MRVPAVLASGVGGRAQMEEKADAGGLGSAEGQGGGAADFDSPVEEVFAGGEEFEAVADVVGGVGVEAEVAVKQVGVCVVVELAAAHAGLEAEESELWAEGAKLGGAHVVGDLGDPVADEVGLLGILGDGGVGVLVAGLEGEPLQDSGCVGLNF